MIELCKMKEEELIQYLEKVSSGSFFDEETVKFFCVPEDVNQKRAAKIRRSLNELHEQMEISRKRIIERDGFADYRECVQDLFDSNQRTEEAEVFRRLKHLQDLLNLSLDCIEEEEGRVDFTGIARELRKKYPQQWYFTYDFELLSAPELYFLLHYSFWQRIFGSIYENFDRIPSVGRILQLLCEKRV